jgi:hypothetical protein
MPAQQRGRLDEERVLPGSRQNLGERRQHRAIGCSQAWASDLSPEHLQLVAKEKDLDLLSRSELPTRTSSSNKRRTAPSRRRTSSQAADAEFASADRTRCGERHRTPPDSISDGDASPAADEFLGPTGKRDLSDRVSIRQVFA